MRPTTANTERLLNKGAQRLRYGSGKRKKQNWSLLQLARKVEALVLIHQTEINPNFSLYLGGKRKRLTGAGAKLKYPDLDVKLLEWFRERRTAIDPNSNTTSNAVARREKVSFKQLQRHGAKLSIQFQHNQPSAKWYVRFMARHRLSLQRPKRNQKIPLAEAYERISSFYSYLRQASRWGPRRGPMGAFTPRDTCNMDESPLTLFGDQNKRSINDIGTANEVEGHLSNKRFATLILTVFGRDNTRIGPVLLFKGKGHVSPTEKLQYAKGVSVFFTPKAVINKPTMDLYVQLWCAKVCHIFGCVRRGNQQEFLLFSKIQDAHPKLFITDSANSHLNSDVIRALRQKRVVVAIIPKGCTMYVQALDVFVFSVFKQHYDDVADEFIEKNGPRGKLKLTASQSRILCTRLTWSAWLRTLKSIDFEKSFQDLGYVWVDNSVVSPRTMPGYTFDPVSDDCPISTPDDEEENRIDKVATEIAEQQKTLLSTKKQLTLTNMWK